MSSIADTEQSEIDESAAGSHHDAVAAYLSDDTPSKDNEVVYCPQLGLAIEKIKEGFTLDSLWQVVPQG